MATGFQIFNPTSGMVQTEAGLQDPSKFNDLYQLIGDVERSSRFYDAGYDEYLPQVTLTVGAISTQAPSVDVAVTDGQQFLVMFYEYEACTQNTSGEAWVCIKDSIDLPSGKAVSKTYTEPIAGYDSTVWRPFSSTAATTAALWPRGQFIAWRTTPGIHTVSMWYFAGVSGASYFRNAKLWGVAL